MRSLAILLLAAPLAIAGPLNPFNLLPRAPIYGCADDESWTMSGCVKRQPDSAFKYECPVGQCLGTQGCTKLGCRPENTNDQCPLGQVYGSDGCTALGAGSAGCPPGQCQGTDGCTTIGCVGQCPPGQCQGTDGCTSIGCQDLLGEA